MLSELASFPAPQMKIYIKWFNYSVTAATSPIIVEVGQWKGETSDATPEDKQQQETQPKNTQTTSQHLLRFKWSSLAAGSKAHQDCSPVSCFTLIWKICLTPGKETGESSTDLYNSRDETQLCITVKVYFHTPNSFKALIMWPPDDMRRVASSFRCV